MSPADSNGLVVHVLHGETMGTSWSVRLVAAADADLHVAHAAIQRVLDDVVAQMSTWEPDSDISRFNRAESGQWQVVPTAFMAVLRCALSIAERSDGAFDPTVGALVGTWGFGAHARAREVPAIETQASALATVGWKRLLIDNANARILQPGKLQLDFSAIAKGYAVDAVVNQLRALRFASALVEIGGELRAFGRKPGGDAWRVLMESSPDEEAAAKLPARVIELDDVAVATSGDRWHAYDSGDERFSHTLDPRSGRPVAHASAGVTVIASNAMDADAWATAFTVLGVDAGIALAERMQYAVRYVVRTDAGLQERMSIAMRARFPE